MSLLNHEQILERLDRKEIFRPETWRAEQLRPAGYDLRIADVRAFNEEIYDDGKRFGETLQLEPGDTAYVLSFERFSMPWDLAANLGIRFRFARRGLSVLTGLLVDPGYGMKRVGREWHAVGAPLQFFVVNIGADAIPIVLGQDGDAVLSVQFLETAPLEKKVETSPPGNVEPSAALWAFHSMRALHAQLDEETEQRTTQIAAVKSEIKGLERIVDSTRSATENIVVFGVFLIAVTLLGVSVTILFQTLASRNIGDIVDNINRIDLQGLSATVVTLAAIFVIGLSVIAMVLAFTKGFAWAFGSRTTGSRSKK